VVTLFGALLARSQGKLTLWTLFCLEDSRRQAADRPLADADRADDIECTQPDHGAGTLCASSFGITAFRLSGYSATLTALGRFDRFSMRAGLGQKARLHLAPAHSNMRKRAAVAYSPIWAPDPRDGPGHKRLYHRNTCRAFWPWLGAWFCLLHADKLWKSLPAGLGSGNFANAYWCRATCPSKRFDPQHRASRQEEPQRHSAWASFAEGMSTLPGRYCEHVVIAKIPFAVPYDPGWKRRQRMGSNAMAGNPFMGNRRAGLPANADPACWAPCCAMSRIAVWLNSAGFAGGHAALWQGDIGMRLPPFRREIVSRLGGSVEAAKRQATSDKRNQCSAQVS